MKNLRFRLLTGQSLVVEDVTEWIVDAQGIRVKNQEVSTEKVGEEMKKIVTVSEKWFNTAAIITFGEEYSK